MKLLNELLIIIAIFVLGELVSSILPFPLPGSIVGMLILLFSLILGFIKIEQIKNISDFFLSNLSFLFLPVSVGLLGSIEILKESGINILILTFITTAIVIYTTGITVELVLKFQKKGEN